MKYLFLLLISTQLLAISPILEEEKTSQKYVYKRWHLVIDEAVNGTTFTRDYENMFSHGITFQTVAVCTGACELEFRVLGSVNCVDYFLIPQVTLTTTESCNLVQNLAHVYFKCFRVESESKSGEAKLNVWVSNKEAI